MLLSNSLFHIGLNDMTVKQVLDEQIKLFKLIIFFIAYSSCTQDCVLWRQEYKQYNSLLVGWFLLFIILS